MAVSLVDQFLLRVAILQTHIYIRRRSPYSTSTYYILLRLSYYWGASDTLDGMYDEMDRWERIYSMYIENDVVRSEREYIDGFTVDRVDAVRFGRGKQFDFVPSNMRSVKFIVLAMEVQP